MKVLYLTYSPSPYRVDFFEELANYVDLTVCFEVTPKEDQLKNKRSDSWYKTSSRKYKSIYLNNKFILKKRISYDPIRIIKNNNFDIIVISGYSSLTAMITMEYLKIKKIAFILSTDGGFPKTNENIIKYKIKKHFISMSNYYLSTGENASNYLKYYGANKNNIYNYPFTTIKEKDLQPSLVSKEEKKKIRKKLKINDKITFISIGRFIDCKGFDIFIKAAEGLKNAQFLIIGDKPTEKYIKIVEDLHLKNISFIDFKPQKELFEYIKASDVFVLATRGDVWGLVINEALSIGIPVITTNKCGAGIDLIKNDYNGFIINVDDIKELHNRMEYFVNNVNKISEMSINALKSIKNYTIENEAKVHFEVFKKILKK